MPGLDDLITAYSIKVVLGGGLVLIILALICLKIKEMEPNLKKILYILIITTTVLSTSFLAGSTIYLNTHAFSGGPVHWHGDYEIYYCGQGLEMEKPHGMSNKIGTSTLHQHGDNKIHIEGVVVQKKDASLGKFFNSVEGQLTNNALIVPTDDGKKSFISGQTCPDGKVAEVQVFVYRVVGTPAGKAGKNYRQYKLRNPAAFVLSPQAQVPPGDCIIIEFGPPKVKTDKLCLSYKVAKQIGKLGKELP